MKFRFSPLPFAAFLALFSLYLALGATGYGVDNDIYEMLRRGRELLRDGTYWPSRSPGYPLPEIVVAAVGFKAGALGVNALSALLGVTAIACLYSLLREAFGPRTAAFAAAVAAFNPYWIVACSSAMDYVYALGFSLAGVWFARRGRWKTAAVLLAAAVASRATYLPLGLIVFAWALARPAKEEASRRERRRAAWAAALYIVMALLPYALIYGAVGGEMFRVFTGEPVDFFSLQGYARLSDFAGRFVFKNVFLWGAFGAVIVGAMVVGWIAARIRRGGSPAKETRPRAPRPPASVTLAVWAGWFYSQILFFRLPLEISYLLPALFCMVYLLAFTPRAPLLLGALLVTQVLNGVVSLELLKVEYAGIGKNFNGRNATAARLSPHFGPGVLMQDLALRREAEAFFIDKFKLDGLPSTAPAASPPSPVAPAHAD